MAAMVSSCVELNPFVILILAAVMRLGILGRWCSELHGDPGAAPNLRSRSRGLIYRKVGANEPRFESSAQTLFGDFTHRSPAEIGDLGVAALIHRDRHGRHLSCFFFFSCGTLCRGLVRQSREIGGRETARPHCHGDRQR